jgi:hypothetical protein
MEILTQYKQYWISALTSLVAVGLFKMGLFVTHGDLEQSLRMLESDIRATYATQRDIEDIKHLLNRVDVQLSRIEDRMNDLPFERRVRP